MDTLSLKLFLRIADCRSVSAAARDLHLSAASASARLSKLEEQVGFQLFNRTTRAVSLTTDGTAFLPYVQQTLQTLEAGLSTMSGKGPQAKGLLRIAMPGSFGRMYILEALAEFQSRHPLVSLDLRLSDEIHDVVEGGYDLIIRNANLTDSSLIARKLTSDRRILVGAPSYLEEFGTPAVPEDLLKHKCINLRDKDMWKFEDGQMITVPQSISVNDGEAMRIMIENGMGIGIKSIWNASKSLKSGKLVEVLEDFPLALDASIWVLYPAGRVVAPKIRVMVDFLVDYFSPTPPWEREAEK